MAGSCSKAARSVLVTYSTDIKVITRPLNVIFIIQFTGLNLNDTLEGHKGIIHLAFGVDTMHEVEEKARQLKQNGFQILSGPRKTGEGYYEF